MWHKSRKSSACTCYQEYSPELNPDEQVWNQLKAKRGRHLNGQQPERWSNDSSQQNLLNLNRFEQL